MSIFGRGQEPTGTRSAEERERARLERERRRAEREGRPAPAAPPVLDEPSWEPVDLEAPVTPEPVAEEPVAEEPVAVEDPVVFEEPVAVEDPVAFEEPVAFTETVDEDPVHEAANDAPVPEEPALEEPQSGRAHPPSWFDDGSPVADPPAELDRGQETVEWDVAAGRPKEAVAESEPEPEADLEPDRPTPAAEQLDRPTVEWDVMSQDEHEHEHEADHEPTVRRVSPTPARARTVAAGAVAQQGRPPLPPRPAPSRFADDGERPVPARRVSRPASRTLPPPPPAPGERRRDGGGWRPRGRTIVLLAIAAILVGAIAWVVNSVFQPFAGKGGENVAVTIDEASSANDIGDELERTGVVDSAFFFGLRARLDGGNLKAGEYTLRRDMSYGDALKALTAGPPPPRTIKITLPEGRARREAAPLVQQAGLTGSYLAASERADGFNPQRYGAPRGVASLEGFLFPATYELEPGSSSKALVGQQLEAFRDNLAQVDMRRARRRNLTAFDVLTIAAMVEREATLDKERPLIAAVIHNRLRQGMPLGIDATIRYATRNWSEPLKQSELAIDSPYNTRRRTGLPPGPIGSPGLASMQAAADPADVDHLFYVVKPGTCGEHNFSATDAEFQRDVAEYNRARDAAGGKSPTTC